MRIEAGTPIFGQDITPDNLPQEVGRDAKAISFVKGCYLGQETVARIDALGHVNKILRGWTMDGKELPVPLAKIEAEGKSVGVVTSSAFSKKRGCVVGLGYIRTAHAREGAEVRIATGAAADGRSQAAVVRDLPISSSHDQPSID